MSFFSGFEKRATESKLLKVKNAIRQKIGLPPQKPPPKLILDKSIPVKYKKIINKGIKNNFKGKDVRFDIKYQKADGSVVERKVTPYTARNKNVLVGFDHHRGEIRSYRADRILDLSRGET